MAEIYYDSPLTGEELDAAFSKLATIDQNVQQAGQSATEAAGSATAAASSSSEAAASAEQAAGNATDAKKSADSAAESAALAQQGAANAGWFTVEGADGILYFIRSENAPEDFALQDNGKGVLEAVYG